MCKTENYAKDIAIYTCFWYNYSRNFLTEHHRQSGQQGRTSAILSDEIRRKTAYSTLCASGVSCMKETHTYRIPDYFPYFACKMGACRNACCQGWPISITLQNYFDLLGLECSPDLRRRLDGGMHIADNPSPEHYAQFSPRYDGNCPLRMEDGRCAIHADIG